MNLNDVPARLYRSEINCSIVSFRDGGFVVRLGDELNGWKAERTFTIVRWLLPVAPAPWQFR